MEALPGEENTTDISSRGELVTRLKERELWWRGQKSVRPPQSNEERMKVNVTVADVMSKPDATSVSQALFYILWVQGGGKSNGKKAHCCWAGFTLAYTSHARKLIVSLSVCLVLLHNWTSLTCVLFWPWWVKGGVCLRINKDQTE